MGIIDDIIHEPFPDAMGKAEHAPGGYFRLFLGGNAYLHDDFMGGANNANAHEISSAVEIFYEMLSGLSNQTLQGSSWLPIKDAAALARYCLENRLICTFIAQSDENLQEKIDACKKAGIVACVSVTGPFTASAEVIGWEEAIKGAQNGERALINDMASKCLENVFAAGEAGADAIVIADEVGSNAGPLVSPDFISSVLMGQWRQMQENASAIGVPAIFHSDGDMRAYYPSLAETGFSGVHISVGDDYKLLSHSFVAAVEAELVPLGGVPAQLLGDEAHLDLIKESIAKLATACPTSIIVDDGGMTTNIELDTYTHVY